MAEYVKPPKHALNHTKLRLSAPCPTAKGKYANLSWDVYNNNPRVVVATNDPSFATKERNFGRITAAMDTPTFEIFLEYLQKAIDSEVAVKWKIENYATPRGAAFGTPPSLMSDLWIGRDQESCVFISVVNKEQEGWPVIKFIFSAADGRFHKVYKSDGASGMVELTKAEMSGAYAKAYVKLLSTMLPMVLVANYVEPPPFVPKGQSNGGGNRGGNGGGYQQRPAAQAPADDNFDDIVY